MQHMLGPMSNGSIATLVRFLLAMAVEICGPFWLNFAVFAILGHVGNTISPWGKGPSQRGGLILVAYDQGSIALRCQICSSDLAGAKHLTVRAAVPKVTFLAVFCPLTCPSPP